MEKLTDEKQELPTGENGKPARARVGVRYGVRKGCTKYRPKTIARLLKSISDGLTIGQSCKAAGIGYSTLYEWYSKHPELEPKLEAAREAARQKALSEIKRAAEKGDFRAWVEFLKLSYFQDYSNKVATQINVAANAASVEITDVERAQLIQKRERALAANVSVEVLPKPEAEGENTEHYAEIAKRETARARGEAAPPLALPLRQLRRL